METDSSDRVVPTTYPLVANVVPTLPMEMSAQEEYIVLDEYLAPVEGTIPIHRQSPPPVVIVILGPTPLMLPRSG